MNTPLHRFGTEALESRVLLNSAGFVDLIDNPYLPFIPGSTYIYRGIGSDGEAVRTRVNVTNQKVEIMGVMTTLVRERAYEDGELVEDTRDYYAQDAAGNVWYFGEDSQEIEDGEVVSTEGSWRAGVDGALPGIIMRSRPGIGDEYAQERAPGVAEDRARVLSRSGFADTPFATFGDCLQTEESNPLEPGNFEHKFYAPGIGFVKSQETVGGTEVQRLAYYFLEPQAFTATIDNPFFPLTPGTTYIYRGVSEDGASVRSRVDVTDVNVVVDGVNTLMVRDREFEDSELVEDTRDFYVQDLAGNVWYFGEDSQQIEDGEVVGTDGSWRSGVDGARAGIIMRAQPGIGDRYQQEVAPGVAEDMARVIGRNGFVNTPFASFGECLQTEEFTPLEPGALEHKFYAPGIGFVKSIHVDGSGEVLHLAYILFG